MLFCRRKDRVPSERLLRRWIEVRRLKLREVGSLLGVPVARVSYLAMRCGVSPVLGVARIDRAELRRMHADGWGMERMARVFRVRLNAVQKVMREEGLKPQEPILKADLAPEVRQLLYCGMSARQVAERYGVSRDTAQKYITRYNLRPRQEYPCES
jgi:predicted XRE-type DNA-binding protein